MYISLYNNKQRLAQNYLIIFQSPSSSLLYALPAMSKYGADISCRDICNLYKETALLHLISEYNRPCLGDRLCTCYQRKE